MTPSDQTELRQQAKNFVKFILENGGVSPNRSFDDAESIMLYEDKRIAAAEQRAVNGGHWPTEREYKSPRNIFKCNCGYKAYSPETINGHVRWKLAELEQSLRKEQE